MTDNRCVIICDSGAGGLRLLKMATEKFPAENFLYFSDYENLPYGDKTQNQLIEIADSLYNKFMSFCPKLIVFACNTLSTAVGNRFCGRAVPTLGVLPDVGNGKGLLICTKATARSDFVSSLKRRNKDLTVIEAVGLAESVEEYLISGKKVDLKRWLPRDLSGYEFVSLGCTHYPYLTPQFKKLFPQSSILSGEKEVLTKMQGRITTDNLELFKGGVTFVGKDKKRLENIFKSVKI